MKILCQPSSTHCLAALKKSYIQTSKSKPCVYVVGNQSVDPDSLFSSLLYSYFKNMVDYSDKTYIPIINCKKEAFKLKIASTSLLNLYSFPVEELIFQEEIDCYLDKTKSNSFTLVDHNQLEETFLKILQPEYSFSIGEIFDHHHLPNILQHINFKPTIEILPLGSCCSLIAQKYITSEPKLNKEHLGIIEILMTVIRIDCCNFEKLFEENRWFYADKKAYMALEEIHNKLSGKDKPTIDALIYNNLITTMINSYKVDSYRHIELIQLLYSDYKKYKYSKHSFGYSVINLKIDEIHKLHQNFLDKLLDFKKTEHLDVLCVFFVFPRSYYDEEKLSFDLISGNTRVEIEILFLGGDIDLEILTNLITTSHSDIEVKQIVQKKNIDSSTSYCLFEDQKANVFRKILEPIISKQYLSTQINY